MKRFSIAAWALFALSGVSSADEFAIKLKPGAGSEATAANCSACHSLDYIIMNSPFPTPQVWDAEVKKMIGAFGADIKADDAKAITEYLTKNYSG